jgi:predicted translin family RNA/ssDNA-binding protein
MKITVRHRTTVRELLDQIQRKYGSLDELRVHVSKHPQDVMAKVALHDAQEYGAEKATKVIRETREIVIPDSAIDQLTVQRLQLLLTLKGLAGAVPSVRTLAKAVKRDIKNVSEDIRVLSELGLVDVEEAGRGKANRISLPGDRIDLHLVESEV